MNDLLMHKIGRGLAALLLISTLAGCDFEEKLVGPPAETPKPLHETVWKLSLLGPATDGGAPTAVPPQSQVGFLLFSEDQHTLKGFAGCQQLDGTYAVEGEQLRFDNLVLTGTRCHNERFDGIGDQFVQVLRNTKGLRLGNDDARLELLAGSTVSAVLHYRTPKPWSW